jgi:N-acetylglutamate synthase-like GNAT family acetyltransferase
MTGMGQRAEPIEAVITHKLDGDFAQAGRDRGLGAARGRFGRTTATRLAALPGHPAYNKARGFNLDDAGHLAAICAFFAQAGVPPRIEVWAGDASAPLGRCLAEAGFYAAEAGATLVAPLAAPLAAPSWAYAPDPRVQVREVEGDDTVYLDTLFEGYGLGGQATRIQRAMMTIEHRSPHLRRYLAYLDGRPAAAAGLYTTGQRCYLAGAATLPEMRGHGCQSALIRRRLQDAAAMSGQSVVVTTAFGSPSQANLQRLGFALVHTRALWRRLGEP